MNSAVVEEILFSLVKNYGKTLILVTHDTALANKAEKRYHLVRGELVTV